MSNNTTQPTIIDTALPSPPAPKRSKRKWLIGGAAAVAIVVIAAVAGASKEPKLAANVSISTVAPIVPATSAPTTQAPTTVPVTEAPETTEAPATTEKPECVNGAGETRNETAESYDVFVCRQGAWTFDRTVAVTTTTEAPPVTEAPAPIEFVDIDARTWKLIAKDPDAHAGEYIRIYGRVTQFDSATGAMTFRANVDGIHHEDVYDFDTNTILVGTEDLLATVVEDDVFVAEVLVVGSYSYDTQVGGNTTVPMLGVKNIVVL